MALAGATEAHIRTFGRWAPRAMLYVRDAILTEDGIPVAKLVEEHHNRQIEEERSSGVREGTSRSRQAQGKWPRRWM